MNTITITQPDDWHIHLRDEYYLERTVADASKQFCRVLAMPNLKKPITDVKMAKSYQQRILSCIPSTAIFQPYMTLYLTDKMHPDEIVRAKESGIILACKLYPAHATTGSEFGVTNINKIYSVLEMMQKVDLALAIHGEVVSDEVDVFDREKYFIDDTLSKLQKDFPQLRMTLEHISTKEAVEFIKAAPKNMAATITVHHLLLNRNAMFKGGLNPHHYCLPIIKRREHQEALIHAATSGNHKFFLGTDSAPHAQHDKEKTCGCAGIYTAHAAIELYTEVFEQANALDKLENFASVFGANFYAVPTNQSKITLVKKSWRVPEYLPYAENKLIPLRAGSEIAWQIKI
jgi:dihydroorotase